MDRNSLHHTIPIGHPTWIWMNIGLIVGIITVFLLSHKQSVARKNNISKGLAILLGLNFIAEQTDALLDHSWTVQTYLPLHLCSLSTFLAIFFLIYRNQWVYEFLIFWSAGAIHAFITPEITSGHSLFKTIEFSISHGGIIITGIFASTQLGFKPRQGSWWKVFLYTQLVLPVIGLINYLLDSNYMYIAQKPNANNPMIIGEWPWYIIGLEFVVLIHFYIFYLLHQKISASHQTTTVPSPLDLPIPHQ